MPSLSPGQTPEPGPCRTNSRGQCSGAGGLPQQEEEQQVQTSQHQSQQAPGCWTGLPACGVRLSGVAWAFLSLQNLWRTLL